VASALALGAGRDGQPIARRQTPASRPLQASWRLTPRRSLATRSGSDGQRGVAPPPRMGREQRALSAPVPQLRYGRRRRRPTRPARRPAACGCRVDPAHLGGAKSVVGRHAALVGRSRGGADSVAEAGSDISSAQLDGPAQFRWGRRRCRAVPARSVTPLQLRRREAKGVTIEGRQTGGPLRRQARLSGPPAGGVHAGCSGAPVTIRGGDPVDAVGQRHDEGQPGGQGQRCGVGLSGGKARWRCYREAGPRVGKRPGEGVPSMVELTLRAGLQPWSPTSHRRAIALRRGA
jgi:hypothetical protein